MGTRNLTMVIDKKGETKIAQYGQWDGYPDGQGVTVLNFIKSEENIKKLQSKLDDVRFLDRDGRDKEFIEEYSKNTPEWSNDPDNRTPEQKRWFETYVSRNIAGEILSNVANSNDSDIRLDDSTSFAADSLFCEWAYVVDFEKGTFEVYTGFNKSELDKDARFVNIKPEKDSEYSPVALVKEYKLTELPKEEDFVNNFTEDDED